MNQPDSLDTSRAPETADDEIALLDLVEVVAANLRLLVLGPLAVGLLALGISFTLTPTFTAQTSFLPPQQQQGAAAAMLQSLGGLGGLAGAAAGLKNPSDQYVSFLKSRTLRDALISRFDLIKRWELERTFDAYKTMDGVVRISAGKDGLISVEVDDADPQFAADLANAHVQALYDLMGRLTLTEAQQRRQFFEERLRKAKDDLTRAEQALKSTGIDPTTYKTSPDAAVGAVAELQAKIAAQEVKIGAMRGYLSETAPDFRQALTELGALRAQLNKMGKLSEVGNGSDDYVARYREFKYQETLFEMFAKQYELARVDESREGALIQVVDVAVPPELKSKPKKALIAVLATLASGFLLLLFVFVRNALGQAQKDEATATQLATIRAHWRRAWGLRPKAE